MLIKNDVALNFTGDQKNVWLLKTFVMLLFKDTIGVN